MINTQAAPFDDLRVRKALAYATPKKDYLEVIGQGTDRRPPTACSTPT